MSQVSLVRFLTGAPLAKALDWGPEDLIVPLLPCFASRSSPRGSTASRPAVHEPAWRSISLDEEAMPNEYVQFYEHQYLHFTDGATGFSEEETSFLDPTTFSFLSCSMSSVEERPITKAEDVLTQYYNQSITAHQDVHSSQILSFESSADNSFSVTSSDMTSSFLDSTLQTPQKTLKAIPVSGPITDLKDIPNSAYLHSINPQTMTVNLIVGVISMPQARSIRSRKGGRDFELVEMLVADETKAGFGINLWLPPVDQAGSNLRAMACSLRPRDIILIRIVALSSFQNNVYGQSLRKDTTKLDLMYRDPIDKFDTTGVYNWKELESTSLSDGRMAKVKRTKDWLMQFVSGGTNQCNDEQKTSKNKSKRTNELPPDSP